MWGVWWMSIKKSVLLGALAVGGISALFALVPGSPVWRILNQPVVVAIASDDRAEGAVDPEPPRTFEIITLLPRDGITAIPEDAVVIVTGAEAAAQMAPTDRVIGVSVVDDHRAYSTSQLSFHEVVNDTIGGVPVAVTW